MNHNKINYQNEAAEIIKYLKKGYFIRHSIKETRVKLYDLEVNPVKYYHTATFNTLLDSKMIISAPGRPGEFILNNQNP
jgi:hypothetical protein